jgi:hemerythrin-like domain-containing protein
MTERDATGTAAVPPAAQPAVGRIKAEHRSLARVIGAMQTLVTQWRAPDAPPDAGLFDALLAYVETVPDRLHHPKEDAVLFPAIRSRSAAGNALIDELAREHARAESLVATVRATLPGLARREPNAIERLATAVDEFAEFYWWHMRKEEDRLLPIAFDCLSDAEWGEIGAAFEANVDPLFGPARSAEFARLYDRIVALAPPPLRGLLDAE